MRLKKNSEEMPSVIVIPMIDIMFFLLVFFMLSTMYMTNLKTVQVKLAELSGSKITQEISFAVTVNEGYPEAGRRFTNRDCFRYR